MKVTHELELGGRKLSLTTGEVAKQAAGAVLIQYGETVVLVACASGPSRPGTDFFPLTCDYRERMASAWFVLPMIRNVQRFGNDATLKRDIARLA